MYRYLLFAIVFFLLPSATYATANHPKCDRPEGWAAGVTFSQLKNDGALTNTDVDFILTSVHQIASQRIGRDLYRQVFKVSYSLKSGRRIEAIAISDASHEECSMSPVTVYRIAAPIVDHN